MWLFIFFMFSETLSGVTTIRAMQAVPRFVRENMERLESSLKTNYSGQAAAQWLELRLQLLGCSVVAGVALIAVIQVAGDICYVIITTTDNWVSSTTSRVRTPAWWGWP